MDDSKRDAGAQDAPAGRFTPDEQAMLSKAGEAVLDAMKSVLGDRTGLAHLVCGSVIGVVAFADNDVQRVLKEAFTIAYNVGTGAALKPGEADRIRREVKAEFPGEFG